MDIDYKSLYTSYSTAALLQIIDMPHNYQVDAVSAAQDVLATRTITDEDRAIARPQPPSAVAIPFIRQTDDDEPPSIFDEVKPDKPSRKFQVTKWMIVCFISLQFVSNLIHVANTIILNLKYSLFSAWSLMLLPGLAIPALAFVALWKFAKMQKWGWLLISSFVLYMIVNGTMRFMLVMSGDWSSLSVTSLIMIIINPTIAYYLQKPEIYGHYIDYALFVKFRFWGLVIAAALFACIFFVDFVFTPGAML